MKKIVLICIFLLHCFSIQAVEVVFRFDDFRLYPDSLQERLLKTFYYHRIPISLAVIPCSEDNLFFKDGNYLPLLMKMNSEGMAEIALHGLNHRFDGNGGEFKNERYYSASSEDYEANVEEAKQLLAQY